jgi:hypothetical protein
MQRKFYGSLSVVDFFVRMTNADSFSCWVSRVSIPFPFVYFVNIKSCVPFV